MELIDVVQRLKLVSDYDQCKHAMNDAIAEIQALRSKVAELKEQLKDRESDLYREFIRAEELEADIAIKQEWMDAMEKSNDRLNNALDIAIEALEVLYTHEDEFVAQVATEALNKIRSE